MRRRATRAEKAAWVKRFKYSLIGFVPCIGGNPEGVTHWSAEQRHWRGGTIRIRLCDMVGNWESAPRRAVDCMTCLTRINNLFIEEPT